MDAHPEVSGDSRQRARAVIRALLDGAPPNGVTPEDLGDWRDVVRGLYEAYEMDGTSGVRSTYEQLARAEPGLRALLAGDAPGSPARPSVPPLPADAQAIYAHEEACGQWLDDYIAYALEVAPGAPRAFHELMGLMLVSAAVARRLCLPVADSAIFTNLYALFIGQSTLYTKSTAQAVGAKLLGLAGLDHLLLNPQATPQALAEEMSYETLPRKRLGPEARERWLQRRAQAAQRMILVDEASGWFGGLRREYNAGLLELVLKLYDCPPRVPVSLTKTGGDVDIVEPYLSFFGCSTPEAMAPHLGNLAMWGNGFFARCAILTPQEPPKRVFFPTTTYTEHQPRPIADRLRQIYELFPVPVAELVEVEDPTSPRGPPVLEVQRTNTHRPESVMLGEGVWQAFAAYTMALRYDLLMDPDSPISADLHGSYGRFGVMGAKVAMLLAAMDAVELPVVIERRHWARAQRIVEAWRANLHQLLREHMATEGERVARRIVERLQKDGGLTARELQQRCHHGAKEIKEALEVLVSSGQVESFQDGRRVVWQLVGGL